MVNNLIDYKEFSSVSSYFNNLIDYRYVICPAGNGLDTHRVRESLLLKIVPIHKINNFTLILKNNGVPGLYIENWEDLNNYTREQLDKYYADFNEEDFKKFSSTDYWLNKFSKLKR